MNRLVRAVPPRSLPGPLRTAVLALGVQSALSLAYLLVTDAGMAAPSMLAVPFVWVTTAVVAVRHVDRPESEPWLHALGIGVGAAYALGLAWLTGTVGPQAGPSMGATLLTLPPGWGPLFSYTGGGIAIVLPPYRGVGIAALGYLLSLSVRDVVDSGLSLGVGGLIALGSCASCALPLLAAVGGALGGAGLGLGALPAVGGGTYLLGTAAYVLAVAVLSVRPSFGRYTAR